MTTKEKLNHLYELHLYELGYRAGRISMFNELSKVCNDNINDSSEELLNKIFLCLKENDDKLTKEIENV